MDKFIIFFIVGILGSTASILPGKEVSHILDGSKCEPGGMNTQTMDTVFALETSPRNDSTSGTVQTRKCMLKINFHGSSQDTGMEVYFFKEVNSVYDVSVTYNPEKPRSKQPLFPSDKWVFCLMSPDHVVELEINYSLKTDYVGNTTVFQTKGVKTCSVKSVKSLEDKPFIQEDKAGEIGGSDEPKVGTATTTDTGEKKKPLDVIIIAGVGVAAVVGIGLSVFAVRRWIRNNAAEERRQSVIRVNSQDSRTRSTSNSLQSTSRNARHSDHSDVHTDRTYGSVRIGGRLPSSEDDSDLFPDDSKSTKTVLEDD